MNSWYVAGAWADGSKHLHLHLQMSVIVSQLRRRLSTCVVRSNAQCLISRVGVISPAARDAAQRREVAGRMERRWREERKAQWMASLRGLGWARSGRCYSLF